MPLRHHTPMTSHLLMIEDDTRLARMVGEYLGQSGFVCAHAANGGDGLALLQDEHSAAPPHRRPHIHRCPQQGVAAVRHAGD